MEEVSPAEPPPAEHVEVARFGGVSLEVMMHHHPDPTMSRPLRARLALTGDATEEMFEEALTFARQFPFLLTSGVLEYDYSHPNVDRLVIWDATA
jgi:hypothetical protein